MEDKKLFLLDAFALIYRAYFAFSNNHRISSQGLNTSAQFGFTNTLLEVLRKEKPSHIAVVFDTAAETERHTTFADYKANRQEMPEDLAIAIPYIQKIIEGFNITQISMDGYEADDLIGTLARKAEKAGFTTYMMTPDKDYGQLVDLNTFIYKPSRSGTGFEIMGVKEICEKWQIDDVNKVVDILGMMGDAVDNIPGIPGVGEKTAIKLVNQFGSMEKLYENTHELKGALKEKVEANKDQAFQSKWLAKIIDNAPIEFDEEALRIKEPNREMLKEIFAELEFRRMAEQLGLELPGKPDVSTGKTTTTKKAAATATQTSLFGEDENAAPEETSPSDLKTITDTKHQYKIADTLDKVAELIQVLSSKKYFCFDTETTGLDANNADLVGMSFSIKKHEGWYVPVAPEREEAQALVQLFQPIFENPKIMKIGQNMKYDMAILKTYHVNIAGALFDTMIAHFLIQPEMRHGMDVMAEAYLKYSPVKIDTLIGKKGKEQKSMRDVPLEQISEYAAEDADITLQLFDIFQPKLSKLGVKNLFDEIEMPLVPVLTAMEGEGIRVNKETLHEMSGLLTSDIIQTETEIQKMAGAQFNVSSPKQVGEILFEHLKIVEKPQKTKTGQYSTGEDVLSKLENKHPIVRRILDYRELVKLKNTYVDVLPEMVNPRTGRIHTSYNQVVAVTGRLSSDNPNLQNIPIRTERGREIRKAFIPRNEKYLLLSADYSQIELRIIASLSKDKGMIEAFMSGEDIHKATAAKVYGVSLKDVTGDMRRNAKMVNFGIIYGISAFGLADRLNISRTEAKGIIENYFAQYPGIKKYMDESIQLAREKGYVETVLGRKRFLRDIMSSNPTVRGFAERNAINAPIQGSAADMIKRAMIDIHAEIEKRKMKSRMLLQVHDELVFDMHKDEGDDLKAMVEDKMKNALQLGVPFEVGMGTGSNWLEAH